MKLKDCKTKVRNITNKTADIVVKASKSTVAMTNKAAILTISTLEAVLKGLLAVLWRLITLPIDLLFGFIMLLIMMSLSRSMPQEEVRYIRCVNI